MISEAELVAARGALASVGIELLWEKRPPADVRQIADCETILGVSLPADLLLALEVSNGIVVTMHLPGEKHPQEAIALELLSVRGIVESSLYLRGLGELVGSRCAPTVVAFADIMDSDYVALDFSSAPLRVFPAQSSFVSEWDFATAIAQSYTQFVERVMVALRRGLHFAYWIPMEPGWERSLFGGDRR